MNIKVEQAIAALKASGKDITADYAAWRNIGFAFVEGFQEQGREYFHQVSQLYPGYDPKACDQQYDRCLKSTGSGISLATFFHYLKEAGINVEQPQQPAAWPSFPKPAPTRISEKESAEEDSDAAEQEEELPSFPPDLYDLLPEFLKKTVIPVSTPQERDMVLVATLAIMSACFPNVHGHYDGKQVLPNLFVFITAKASSGKGILNLLKKLVLPIHGEKREEAKKLKQEYEEANAGSGKEGGEKKPKPAEKMLLIPANSSATGIFQLLNDNDGRGLILETEGDTLSQVFKQDYGNYSDGFRKAFHHETISYYRRTDREYVDIESPALSAMLTGTPSQIHSLIPSAENGLFSRFLFYHIGIRPEWKDVFANHEGINQWQHYKELGKEFYHFWKKLEALELEFTFTLSQKRRFNNFFSLSQKRYFALFSDDYLATVRRMGLMSFRMAMIFSILRLMEDPNFQEEKKRNPILVCSEEDFESVLDMISVLIRHSSKVFRSLPIIEKAKVRKNIQETFLDSLPSRFTRKIYLSLAEDLKISSKSAERYIQQFIKASMIERQKYNDYVRVEDPDFK